MPAASTSAEPRAGHREWSGLCVLALPAMLLFMTFSVLFLAIPHLAAGLKPTSTQMLWILDFAVF
jgi:DHA2 family multidrug resistance protein-like MFS transporter